MGREGESFGVFFVWGERGRRGGVGGGCLFLVGGGGGGGFVMIEGTFIYRVWWLLENGA